MFLGDSLLNHILQHHVHIHVKAPESTNHLLLALLITQILDPTHLSTNSDGRSWEGLVAMALVGNAILLNARRH